MKGIVAMKGIQIFIPEELMTALGVLAEIEVPDGNRIDMSRHYATREQIDQLQSMFSDEVMDFYGN